MTTAHNPVPVNFGGLETKYAEQSNAKAVIVPIPFDGTTSYGKGSDKGPAAMIEASRNMELYDIETQSEAYTHGIFTDKPVLADTSPEMAKQGFERVRSHLESNKFVISLGGEHAVSVGPIRAHAEKYPDMCVLQLDAHTDLRAEYMGNPLSHASAMARALDYVKNVIAVGIRSMDSSELPRLVRENVFFAEELYGRTDWIDAVVARLASRVYITVDLDVFDPAYLPSTGTPEPGGLDWYQVTRLLRAVFEKREVVGCDVVELAPGADPASDFTAAKLIYKLLTYKFCLKK